MMVAGNLSCRRWNTRLRSGQWDATQLQQVLMNSSMWMRCRTTARLADRRNVSWRSVVNMTPGLKPGPCPCRPDTGQYVSHHGQNIRSVLTTKEAGKDEDFIVLINWRPRRGRARGEFKCTTFKAYLPAHQGVSGAVAPLQNPPDRWPGRRSTTRSHPHDARNSCKYRHHGETAWKR